MIDNNMKIDLVIHADTGEEQETTHKTLKQLKLICDKHKIEFVIVKSHYGNLYDYYFGKKKLMSFMKRDCTSKFKISPIRQYIRKHYGKKEKFEMYIGMTIEEYSRVRSSDVKYMVYKYPLVDNKVTRDDCLRLLKKYNISASKSACKGCIFTKKYEWRNMLKSNPKEFERHLRLEKNCNKYPKITINPNYRLIDIKEDWGNQETLIDIKPNCEIEASCFL